MFDSRPVSIPLGKLAAAASAGVALALEARASVAAYSPQQFPDPGTTTGMYPPEPSWNAAWPTTNPGTTTGMYPTEPSPWEPTYASASPVEPVTIGRMEPDPTDPSNPPVYAGYSDPMIRPTLTGAIAPMPFPEPTWEPSTSAAPSAEPEPWDPWGDPTILGMRPVDPFEPFEPALA